LKRTLAQLQRTTLATALLIAGTTASASGQVFLATSPHPEFSIGPLILQSTVPQDLGTVQVNLSWSLSVPTGKTPPKGEDLFILWPREVAHATTTGVDDSELSRYVESRGLHVLSTGRLLLRARERSRIGTGNLGEPLGISASFVTFMRAGFPQLGIGTYIRVPWTPKFADPQATMTLSMPLNGMIGPKRASWFAELFWGRRYILTSSFGDVGQIALSLFPIYFERRDHVVPLARDFSLMTVNFPDADHLRIEEISPPAATRRTSRVRAGNETVALLLPGGDGIASQVLRVEFNYFCGMIAWRPILVSLALLAIGNIMGTVMLGRSVGTLLRRWFWLGRGGTPPARRNGVVMADDTLRSLKPGISIYADVIALCGPPQEERRRFAGRQLTLIYRGTLLTTHRRFGFGWLATVSHRDVEQHEVVVEIEDDRVRDVEWRVGRSRVE
jgi:hypothetical protein